MESYTQNSPINLPNPGFPPEGFPLMIEELTTHVPNYDKKTSLDNIVYRFPSLEREEMILPGNINPGKEDYKPTLGEIIFH